MPKVGTAYVSIRARLDRLEKDLSTAKSTTLKSANSTSKAVSNIFKGAVAYFGVTQIKAFGEELFEAGKQVNRLNKAYSEITGSTSAANQEFDFLRKTANDLGQNFYVLADAYKGFLASSKAANQEAEITRRIFTSVIKASSSLGLASEDTAGAIRAIEQSMSKGKVQAEELRGQLGERLPGAFSIMAEALGVTTAELDKMLEQGQVTSDAWSKFADILDKKYTGAADDATRASNKLSEAWQDLKIAIGDGGYLDVVTQGIKTLADIIGNQKFQSGVKEFSRVLSMYFFGSSMAAKSLGDISKYQEEIDSISKKIKDQESLIAQDKSDMGGWRAKILGAEVYQKQLEKHIEDLDLMKQRLAYLKGLQWSENNKPDKINPFGTYTQPKQVDIYTNFTENAMDEHVKAWESNKQAIKDAQTSLEEYSDAMDNFSSIARSSLDAWDPTNYDVDSGFDEVTAAIERTSEAEQKRIKILQEEFDLQKALANAIEDTYDIDSGIGDFVREMEDMNNEFSSMVDDTSKKATDWSDTMTNAFSGWATSYASELNNMLWNSELTFDGILESFGKMITQMVIQSSISSLFSAAGNFNWSSLFTTGSTMHSGGIVGAGGTMSQMPAWMFAGAPRLHSGLSSDEFPAILQKGETVIPKGQSGSQSPSVSLNIENKTGQQIGGNDVRIMQQSPGKYVANIILKNKATSKKFRHSMGVR